jgi:hypothetical protein
MATNSVSSVPTLSVRARRSAVHRGRCAPGRPARCPLLGCACAVSLLLGTACGERTDLSAGTIAHVDELEGVGPEVRQRRSIVGRSGSGIDPRDRGIGLLYFDRQAGSDTGGDADTLLVLRDTVSRRIVARYVLRRESASWSYTVESGATVESNSLELGPGIEGLPVDRATADERWVVAIYGRGADGASREGWVKVTPGKARFTPWSRFLRERALFFAEGVVPEFHGSARGTPVEFALAAGSGTPQRADYIMHPLEVAGDWMQVRVTSPSDRCASPPAAPRVRQMVLWIRYLDARGRPRVWYHTRDC